jgi:hypothetical protein
MSIDERVSEPTVVRTIVEHARKLAVGSAALEDRSIAPTGPRGHETTRDSAA